LQSHSLFRTRLGPLDCLGAVEGSAGFDQLAPFCIEVDLGGARVRILSLEKLIELKRQWQDDESQLRLRLLERTLRERRG
jgi:hypothetical protein